MSYITSQISSTYSEYFNNKESLIHNIPKIFWNYVNKKRVESIILSVMSINMANLLDPQEIVHSFDVFQT